MELAGVVWDAATRLFSCGKVHAGYVYKLEENLESLQRKWVHLTNLSMDVRRRIDDAEGMGEMQRADEVKGWLQDIQNFQKVMEDIQDQDSQETHKKCVGGCCLKNCLSSYKLGKKIVKMISEIDGLVTSGKRFVDKNVYIAYKLPPKSLNEMPSIETVGLDLMLNQVWNSLKDDSVGSIGLYGMGGAGKTTLMMKIHNEFGKREHNFALVLWVVVSRDCDINKVMNDIRNRLGIIDDAWNKSNQHERVAKIYQVLKQRKFVLMLDDLWGKLELEMVGVPLPKDTNNQSKVLFTTRLEDVCAKMQAQKKFKVECLVEKEAFDLFCKKVGDETLKCHIEIPKLAWEMAKDCKGLPLALITVGSSMAGVKSVEAWRQAKNNLGSSPWVASYLEEEVFRILKFSYDRLPDETHKTCFLYCALYPEDYEVGVNDLIDRWIGEGFLSEDKIQKSVYDMYEQGESIIEKLKLLCLLEGVEYDYFWSPAIKMHDVVRDMALWLARDQDGNKAKVVVQGEALAMSEMDDDGLNIVERISIIDASGSWAWQIPTCPNLLTLCILDNVESTVYSNLQSMTRLKVLDLSGKFIEHLPVEIGSSISDTCYLHKLRRVYVESCDSITHLTWLKYALLLEFLEVRNCNSIEEVVKEGENDIFQNLRILRFYGLPKLMSIHRRALDFPFLKYIHVYECPNLKKLPLNSSFVMDNLIAIKGQNEWWNNLEWEDTDSAIKDLLHSKYRPR
ncbi:P-loop containing nucleoside triphosphate hydrolase [Sesbania bispinosa]|nr:P-loop containing nucleoside triphosphate hydrolase [Sesbania bispinosa]